MAYRAETATDRCGSLCEPGATLTAVAHKVGYGSPFALSTAFKRERGISPARYRDACG
ncbi:hypothetical protein DQ238_06525 [Geodermatophilus sp. TF02-6]|uniref:helix-turn-helix domain-containing protein n=1 Tax=Geodermatophilus sp. TF02-6 TaxID=2250575 RepID=UPI000DEADF37|nr:AraC family transcriptional regulator [Geodermatophilus sp. TF02-6]RBY81678.1 hypothetical protein DQ238_06525 [Geodermatophilus sp. TF02-6]